MIAIDIGKATVRLEKHNHCLGCAFWSMGKCSAFDVELPPYASPHRPAVCLAAEGEARARTTLRELLGRRQ